MTKSNTKLTNDCSRPAERGNKKHPRQSKIALRPGLEYSAIRVFFILVIGYFGVTIWVFFFYIFGIWYLDTNLCRYFDKWSKCVQQKFARSWEWEGKNKPRDRQKCTKKLWSRTPLYRHSLIETMDTFFLANQQIDIKSTSLMRTLHCQLFAVINRSFFMVKKI